MAIIFYSPGISMWAIILVGLFNSVLFPIIFSISVAGMGKATAYASGLLCTCIVGGALVPLLQALMADGLGLRYSFFIPFLCYLYIVAFASKIGLPSKESK
jgi:FHS family L-fucose permease-like MFS transporter